MPTAAQAGVYSSMMHYLKSVKQAGMTLRRKPVQPTPGELQNVGRRFPPNHLHDTWMDYLYWDAELEA